MKTIFVRAPYNYCTDKVSDETGLKCLDKSRTHQSFADDSDINTIVNRFLKTGQLPPNVRVPEYADFEGILDFHDAMNAVRVAQEDFDRLPAQLRARFHNNPQELLEFVADNDNIPEARKLGLIPPLERIDQTTGEIHRGTPKPAQEPQTPKVAPSKEGTT